MCNATIYSQMHNYSLDMLCDLNCITFGNFRHTLRQISYHIFAVLLPKAEVKAFLILEVYCFFLLLDIVASQSKLIFCVCKRISAKLLYQYKRLHWGKIQCCQLWPLQGNSAKDATLF